MFWEEKRRWKWKHCDLLFVVWTTSDSYKWWMLSCSAVSNSLWPHGLQHTRLLCPSPSPRVCSNSCPLRRWCHPTISSSVIPFSCSLQSFPGPGSFSNESALCISWPKYWSFRMDIRMDIQMLLANISRQVRLLNVLPGGLSTPPVEPSPTSRLMLGLLLLFWVLLIWGDLVSDNGCMWE